ncbi:MAG: 2-oxo acid dehydrogenase subunit E2 [Bdellovibrionaceae bacterium]|nr:2-oxo acid dehydrogenase subunit E2 [Pseudobdellovibrionaceae bacterium]
MATKNVQLPEIGEGVTEGELVNWLVKVGDKIEPDQAIAELMTDKATVEVPSPIGGVVKELKFKEGDVITVGSVVIVVDADGAAAAAPAPTPAKSAAHTPAPQPAPAAFAKPAPALTPKPAATTVATTVAMSGGTDVYPPPASSRVLATPATRRLAREMGVDVNSMNGTGMAGRVTREDVLGARGAGAVSGGPATYQAPSIPRPGFVGQGGAMEERVQLKGIRKKIAENLQMAKHIIPHFTLMDEANVTALVAMREELKAAGEKAGVKVTYMPFVFKALIATVREFPMFNASIDDAANEIVYKKYFNVGFAADTPNGLLVPVVKNADQKSILQVAKEITELATKARDGKLALDEMKNATFTVTNIGSVGGTYATPVINHPEVAIFGMYKIQDKPVLKDGKIEFTKTMNFTVTADHRLIDGAVAARFLKAFIHRIENPGVLMLDMM